MAERAANDSLMDQEYNYNEYSGCDMRGLRIHRHAESRSGSAAVEFALVGPLLVVLLIGIVVYGGWFLLAQAVQSLAADGARAAMGGLDDAERADLARSRVEAAVGDAGGLEPGRTRVVVTEADGGVEVAVLYDIRDHPLMLLGGMLPRPPAVIERSALVRLDGY